MTKIWMQAGARAVTIASLLALGLALSAQAQQVGVDGIWQSEDGEGRIEVGPCESSRDLRCGKIVWIKTPLTADGKAVLDSKNPVDGLKSRPICGIQILSELQPIGAGDYDRGQIYDPEEGKIYAGSMKLVGEKLKITGSVDVPILGPMSDSESWTRVTQPFTRCATVAQK